MKLGMVSNGIKLIPETDFETLFLSRMFLSGKQRKIVVETGVSVSDLESVIVMAEKKDPKDPKDVDNAKKIMSKMKDIVANKESPSYGFDGLITSPDAKFDVKAYILENSRLLRMFIDHDSIGCHTNQDVCGLKCPVFTNGDCHNHPRIARKCIKTKAQADEYIEIYKGI